MGIDRGRLALPAASLAVGLLTLEHEQTGRGDRASHSNPNPNPIAAGPLDRHHQPRARGMSNDPGSSSAKPAVSLLTVVKAIGAPFARAISTW